MTGATDTLPAASASLASYHFQQFVLRLPQCTVEDLFDEVVEGERRRLTLRDVASPKYALLAHEMTHYMQGLSTVLGQRIILDWFAVVIGVGKHLQRQDPLRVPVWKASGQFTASLGAVRLWNEYMGEINALVGATLPLRPAEEVASQAHWSFFEYEFEHPRGGKAKGIALAVPRDDETCVGLPLQGDVFTEGHAQAVQWLADGLALSPAERLKDRPLEPRGTTSKVDLYYTAIARLVLATLPGWDWLQTTALLCDVALCSATPAMSFVAAYQQLRRMTARPGSQFPAVRLAFEQTSYLKGGRKLVGERLAELADQLPDASDPSAAGLMRRIVDLMVNSWQYRNSDPYYFLDTSYRKPWVQRVVQAIGAPPIFVADEEEHGRQVQNSAITLTDDASITKACFWARGSFDLMSALQIDGLRDPCPFLATRTCDWHKTSACREGDLLNAPTHEESGKMHGCHMAMAAAGLDLYGRAVRRL